MPNTGARAVNTFLRRGVAPFVRALRCVRCVRARSPCKIMASINNQPMPGAKAAAGLGLDTRAAAGVAGRRLNVVQGGFLKEAATCGCAANKCAAQTQTTRAACMLPLPPPLPSQHHS